MKKLWAIALCAAMVVSLAGCGGGGAAQAPAAQSGGAAAETKPEFTITYANTISDVNPLGAGCIWLGQRIEELSEGRIKVNVFTNSKLGPASEFFPQMQKENGTVQMGDAAPASISQFSEAFAPLSLPFLFKNAEQSFKYVDNSEFIKGIEQQFLEETNTRVLGYFFNGTRGLTNSKRPITKPEDVKGLKLRVMTSDVFIKTFEAMGASTVSMQMAEVFTALQQGAVDGQDNGLLLTMDSKFNDVQKYFTDLAHVHDTSIIYVSESFWQSLPEDLQQIVMQAVDEAVARERQDYLDKNDAYLEEMRKTMEVTILTDEERAAFKEACAPVYDWFRGAFPQYDIDAVMKDIEENY